MKISHFQLTSEPPKLPAGDQRTWILEVDCFPLLRPGNVERSVTEGGLHMVWKGGGWINCMMEKSPASALTSASKCWKKNGDLHLFSPWRTQLSIFETKKFQVQRTGHGEGKGMEWEEEALKRVSSRKNISSSSISIKVFDVFHISNVFHNQPDNVLFYDQPTIVNHF